MAATALARATLRDGTDEVARIATRVLAGLDELVAHMGELYCAHVPEYAALGEAEIRARVLPISRRVVETFFGGLVAGHHPAIDEIGELRDSGRRRLEMGVALEPMLHVYRLAGRAVWERVVAATEPGEERALGELGVRWFDFIDQASSTAAAGYLEASHERLRRLDARRRDLLDALLSVDGPSDAAAAGARLAISVAPAYLPVIIDGPGVHARLDDLAHAAPSGAVSGPWGPQILVLLPEPGALPALAALRPALEDLLVVRGVPTAPGSALRAEVAAVADAVPAALRRGLTAGEIGPDDLLLERLAAASPRLVPHLAAPFVALAAADRDGVLRCTLQAYLGCGSVPETARAVFVHANTVAYRLGRVAAITGLNPRVPTDAARLMVAEAAVALAAGEERP